MEKSDYPISKELAKKIEKESLMYLGEPYTTEFKCMTFVRIIYGKLGLALPPLSHNVRPEELSNPPVGYVLYLRRRASKSGKAITHVAIIISERRVIHCSYYFGKKVVITPIDEILNMYEISKPNLNRI